MKILTGHIVIVFIYKGDKRSLRQYGNIETYLNRPWYTQGISPCIPGTICGSQALPLVLSRPNFFLLITSAI